MTIGLRKNSLLVVDDMLSSRNELRDIGVTEFFDVTTAASHREAAEAIRRRCFDAALVDMRLYAGDDNNKEGLRIVEHLAELKEGTAFALLTNVGSFEDAAEAQLYGARAIPKRDPKFIEIVRRYLRDVAEAQPSKRLNPNSAWSGGDHPDLWSTNAKIILSPRGDVGVIIDLMKAFLLTCDPIRERTNGLGLKKLQDLPALAGLYWSRGLGEAIAVVVARDEIPSPVPAPLAWAPAEVQNEMYRTTRRNLVGAIFRCSGVGPEDFPVKRPYLE